jgi:hypothetical protein
VYNGERLDVDMAAAIAAMSLVRSTDHIESAPLDCRAFGEPGCFAQGRRVEMAGSSFAHIRMRQC